MTNEKKPLFNLLDFFHVGYKKPTPEQLKYGNFNRRMFAFTIDTILLMIFIAPLVDYFFTVIYGPFPIDMQQLGLEMQAAATEEEKKQIFITTIKETGALDRWVAGTVTQLMVLLAIIGAFWYRWSATPGKMVMHLRIVDARTEGPITLYHIVLRL
ncbi:MAG: RDD family protein, partial [Alphaproteobacteria bacterium]